MKKHRRNTHQFLGLVAINFYRPHCAQRKPPVFNLLSGRF